MAIRYTHKEELWNAWSHAGGIVMGVAFGIVFLVMAFKGDNPWARLGVCLYLFGMLGSYAASTIYHTLPRRSKWKERLRKWDHAAIYWHIAGSYSPLTLVALRNAAANYSLFTLHFSLNWGWVLFIFVWACAIVGTAISFIKLKEHSNILFHRYGSERIGGFQAVDGLRLHSCRHLAHRRGRRLYHGCCLLYFPQEALYAQRLPLLRPPRQHLSHHRRLGRADGIPLIIYNS